MRLDLRYIAARYATHAKMGGGQLSRFQCRLDSDFIRSVADWYESVPISDDSQSTKRQYEKFKCEIFSQYDALARSGLTVEPWVHPGQPYMGASHLFRDFEAHEKLYVYLTRYGHGDVSNVDEGDCCARPSHPMKELTGIRVHNIDLMYNDLFRAIHDIFGHIMGGYSFNIEGELTAAREHAQLFSPAVHPVLLSETVGQICWFYGGPHLARAITKDAAANPYPPQKTSPMPQELISEFFAQFEIETKLFSTKPIDGVRALIANPIVTAACG